MKSHYFDYIELCPPFRHLLLYEGWSLVRVVVRQGFYCIYSIDESGLEPQPERMAECALLAHHRMLTSYDELVRSALGLGCGSCTKSMYEIWHEEHDV